MIMMNNLSQTDRMKLMSIQDLEISEANRWRLLEMYCHHRSVGIGPIAAFKMLDKEIRSMPREERSNSI